MAELSLNDLRAEYKKATDPKKKLEFKAKIQQMVAFQTPEEVMVTLKAIDNRVSEIEEGIELGEIADMASMSYIAKKYFNKSRTWLYQRINGNVVNGKPAKFTKEEKETFAKALQDMSRKFEEKSLSIMNG